MLYSQSFYFIVNRPTQSVTTECIHLTTNSHYDLTTKHTDSTNNYDLTTENMLDLTFGF